jgi:hypothetical protein
MASNISKYLQLNDFLLLEYEFNKDGVETNLYSAHLAETTLGYRYFYESDSALGFSNNILPLNSMPINPERTNWYFDASNYNTTYPLYWNSTAVIATPHYVCDTLKVHIISGYNFDDIAGFLLQVRALDTSSYLVDLANFTYAKQPQTIGSAAGKVVKFSPNVLYLGNRFYDKYVEFKVPSIQSLGGALSENIENALKIATASDVYLTYSTIDSITDNQYIVNEIVNIQLPVTSVADNFNCFIAESQNGDFIEYYATWAGLIIGNYINDIESGRIQLYTSNNPNDNYEQFTDTYGIDARKWILIHEISVYEQLAGIGGTSLLTQKFSYTQDANFSSPNYFRPILQNADIDTSYTIQYTSRLLNRMDGTQIIRKASFASTDPKKYGFYFTRLNVDNLIPYKVFNKVEAEKPNVIMNTGLEKTKYVKVFFDTTTIVMNAFNEILPQGMGPLFLKSYDSVYKFKFERIDTNGDRVNVDLSGAYNYGLLFKLDDGTKLEVGPTYSSNMNTTIGEIEFKLTEDQLNTLQTQTNNNYSIIVKNPNGTAYTFYEGVFYNLADEKEIMDNYSSMFTVTDLQAKNAELQSQVTALTDDIAKLKTT